MKPPSKAKVVGILCLYFYAHDAILNRYPFPPQIVENNGRLFLAFDDRITESAYFPVPDETYRLIQEGKYKVEDANFVVVPTIKNYYGTKVVKIYRKGIPHRNGDILVARFDLLCGSEEKP